MTQVDEIDACQRPISAIPGPEPEAPQSVVDGSGTPEVCPEIFVDEHDVAQVPFGVVPPSSTSSEPRLRYLRHLVERFRARFCRLTRLLRFWEVANRAALARRFGVSAMRVMQVLTLLKLDRKVREAIFALPAGTPDRSVSERSLRPLLGLSPAQQRRAFGYLLQRKKPARFG